MQNIKNWIWGGVAALAGVSLLKASQLNNLAKEFLIDATSRPYGIDFQFFTIAVDVVFKNPTDATISLKHPTVSAFDSLKAVAANQPFVSSEVIDRYYTISPNAQTKLAPILIKIPISIETSLRLGKWVIAYMRDEVVYLQGRVTTTVNGFRVEKLIPLPLQRNPPVNPVLAGAAYADPAGVRVRINLAADNSKKAAQTISSSRVAIYANMTDQAVDAPLWQQETGSVAIPAQKVSRLILVDGVIATTLLANYPNMTSVLIEATVTVGGRLAKTIISVNLPHR